MEACLSRQLIVETYTRAHEAERSVDAALGADWSEFTAYFDEQKTKAIRLLVDRLREKIPTEADYSKLDRDEVGQSVPQPGLLRVLFGRWIAARKRAWRFSRREVAFIVGAFAAFLDVLEIDQRPAQEALIALRMDLYVCRYVIDCRCFGLTELTAAREAEHFRGPRWLKAMRSPS